MSPTPARGLPASWLNAWLAAIGVTVLVPDVRLSWSHDASPTATFAGVADLADLADRLWGALPSEDALAESTIARDLTGHAVMGRNFSVGVWEARAATERRLKGWQLAASATDLVALADGDTLPHSPFDPAVPKGLTLHDRLVSCRQLVEGPGQVLATLTGSGEVRRNNGLGFDARRLPTAVGEEGVYVDPVIEVLAFHGLALFPCRGPGRGQRVRTRGWTGRATVTGSFTWPAWATPIDRWGVDALLDRYYDGGDRGVLARFEAVPYQPKGSADTTRAYAGRRVD